MDAVGRGRSFGLPKSGGLLEEKVEDERRFLLNC